jgi:hypothetical protein
MSLKQMIMNLKKVLIERDGISEDEANELISNAKLRVLEGENAEEILEYEFGVEPDYIFDIMPF